MQKVLAVAAILLVAKLPAVFANVGVSVTELVMTTSAAPQALFW